MKHKLENVSNQHKKGLFKHDTNDTKLEYTFLFFQPFCDLIMLRLHVHF